MRDFKSFGSVLTGLALVGVIGLGLSVSPLLAGAPAMAQGAAHTALAWIARWGMKAAVPSR